MRFSEGLGKVGRVLGEMLARNLGLLVILAVALGARLFVYFHTPILNPDGPLYIFQARALAAWDLPALTKCGLNYVSIYPFLIYGAHFLVANWDTAAQLVSLFFGTALMVPAYLLLREFFSQPVGLCGALAFGLAPIVVGSSVDVVRDPIAWFFLVTGQWLVVLAIRRQRRLLLLLALAAFSLAIWARIEAFVYILATALSLPLISGRERWRNLAWFCGVLLFLAVLALLGRLLAGGHHADVFRFGEILQRANLLQGYEAMRREVEGILLTHQSYSPGNFFLAEAKRFAWLIAIAGVLNRLVEAFSYGFSLLFLLGIYRFRQRFAGEGLRHYFPILCGLSFLLLYAFMVQSWVMEYRYAVLVIVGGLVVFAAGVEWLMELLGRYLQPTTVVLVTGTLLFLSVAPKIFQDRAASELAFKEIGLTVAATAPGPEPVLIMASLEHIRLLTHYANSRRAVPQCPQPLFSTYEKIPTGGPGEVADYLRANRIGFVLWEEKNWPTPEAVPFLADNAKDYFVEMGRWDNHQAGRMILYRVV